MTTGEVPLPDVPTRPWVEGLSESDRAQYEIDRAENIEETAVKVGGVLDEFMPGLRSDRPEEFDKLVLRWATGLRNTFEEGIQVGKDAWTPRRDDYARSFMRNVVGND